VHDVSSSIEQSVGVPPQVVVTLVDQVQPTTLLQAVWVASPLQVVIVPVQVLQLHPYSAVQAVDVVFALQGVTVPMQAPVPDDQ
jgi:hypothetical protein